MKEISAYLLPCIVVSILLFGAFSGVDVFSEFLDGAKKGFKIILNITPSLIALIIAINLLKS